MFLSLSFTILVSHFLSSRWMKQTCTIFWQCDESESTAPTSCTTPEASNIPVSGAGLAWCWGLVYMWAEMWKSQALPPESWPWGEPGHHEAEGMIGEREENWQTGPFTADVLAWMWIRQGVGRTTVRYGVKRLGGRVHLGSRLNKKIYQVLRCTEDNMLCMIL